MKSEQVTCDGCGTDITVRTNSVDYRLMLAAESKPGYGAGAYTDMAIYPPIKRAHHFCGLGCLDLWRDRERLRDKLVGEKWAEWKEQNAIDRRPDGRVFSYPSPPEKTADAWAEEAAAVALETYPVAPHQRRRAAV